MIKIMYGNATIEQIKRAKECIASELKPRVKTVMPDKVYTPTEIGANIKAQVGRWRNNNE